MPRIDFEYANKVVDLFFKILILVFIIILLAALVYSIIESRWVITGLSIAGISGVYLLYMRNKVVDAAAAKTITPEVLMTAISSPRGIRHGNGN